MTSSVEGFSIPNVGSAEHEDMSEDCSRKSLSSRSLQDTNVSSDPSILLPAIINKAENLATYSKALASKVGINRSESDGNLGLHKENELANNCRKLLQAVGTAQNNMDELVAKIEGTANIEVDKQTTLPTVEHPRANDASIEYSYPFFDLTYKPTEASTLQASLVEGDHKLSPKPLPIKCSTTEANSHSPDVFAPSTTSSPTASSARGVGTPSLGATGNKSSKCKRSTRTPTSKERTSSVLPASNDEVIVNSTLGTSTPDSPHVRRSGICIPVECEGDKKLKAGCYVLLNHINYVTSSDSEKKEQKKRRHSRSDFQSSESEENKKKRKKKRSSPSDEVSEDDDPSQDGKFRLKSRHQIKRAAHKGMRNIKKLVLDIGPEAQEEPVTVDKHFVTKLMRHQVKGVKFMVNACFKSIEKEHPGCILAHYMGSGKKMQVVTLVHTVLTNPACKVDRVLVVCPYSSILVWKHEFEKWLPPNSVVKLVEMASYKGNSKDIRWPSVKKWKESGGVLIIGHDMFRNVTNPNYKCITAKQCNDFNLWLVNPGADLVILDEAHLLKHEGTKLYKAMNKIATRKRVVLTGTPLQKNSQEYNCLIQFVKPNLAGSVANQQQQETVNEVKETDLKSIMLPRLKHDHVVIVKNSELQLRMYRSLYNSTKGRHTNHRDSQTIWTHPLAVEVAKNTRNTRLARAKNPRTMISSDDSEGSEGSISDFLDDLEESPVSDDDGRPARGAQPEDGLAETSKDKEDMAAISGKLKLLIEILRLCESIRDKVLVFCPSPSSLTAIEIFLAAEHAKNEANWASLASRSTDDCPGRWVPGEDYFRYDGYRTANQRKKVCDAFNNPSNHRARLILLSTKAGGLGINLVAANRVIIFNSSWDTSEDSNCTSRVYRIGQKKDCFIYRFLAESVIEEEMFDRKVRHLNPEENMYKGLDRPTPLVPKDELLAKLYINLKTHILTFYEKDPPPENKSKEEQTEAERKAAWADYENKLSQRGAATDLENQQPASKIVPNENNNDPVKLLLTTLRPQKTTPPKQLSTIQLLPTTPLRRQNTTPLKAPEYYTTKAPEYYTTKAPYYSTTTYAAPSYYTEACTANRSIWSSWSRRRRRKSTPSVPWPSRDSPPNWFAPAPAAVPIPF